jgi:hypothetical protein
MRYSSLRTPASSAICPQPNAESSGLLIFSIGEIELLSLSTRETLGDYAAWNCFPSLARPENRVFVEKFRSVWTPAGTTDAQAIRQALRNQRFDAPAGPVQIDSENWPLYCDHSVTSVDVRLSVGCALDSTSSRMARRSAASLREIVTCLLMGGLLLRTCRKVGVLDHLARLHNVTLSAYNSGR